MTPHAPATATALDHEPASDPPLRSPGDRALWYVAPGRAELRTVEPRAPGPGEVEVVARYGAISRGTESLVFAGAVPVSEYARMRAPHQEGAFPFPVKYGYASVGTVVAGEPALVGRTVFALVPHQSRWVLPADAVLEVPADVPARRAVLAANVETALNALWDGGALPGARIAVIGAGVVGAACAWLAARLPGTQVTLVDVRESRSVIAGRLGARFALPDAAPRDCDLVIHASASGAGLATALACAGDEARVVELSWYGDRETRVALGGVFHSGRLRLVSSQVGRVAPAMRARWDPRRRLQAALALLADDRLDVLLDADIAFDALADALPRVLGPHADALCPVVAYAVGPRAPRA